MPSKLSAVGLSFVQLQLVPCSIRGASKVGRPGLVPASLIVTSSALVRVCSLKLGVKIPASRAALVPRLVPVSLSVLWNSQSLPSLLPKPPPRFFEAQAAPQQKLPANSHLKVLYNRASDLEVGSSKQQPNHSL